jgi:hypothetical protein
LVEIDIRLETLQRIAERLTTGNVAHDGAELAAAIRALRRRIGTRAFKEADRG